MVSDEDPLKIFDGQSVCPNCAAISPVGTAKCPECDVFHIVIEEEESRDDFSEPSAQPSQIPEKESRDPGFYSINPHESIPVEHFEADEDAVTDWEGSSIDFGLEDDE